MGLWKENEYAGKDGAGEKEELLLITYGVHQDDLVWCYFSKLSHLIAVYALKAVEKNSFCII